MWSRRCSVLPALASLCRKLLCSMTLNDQGRNLGISLREGRGRGETYFCPTMQRVKKVWHVI